MIAAVEARRHRHRARLAQARDNTRRLTNRTPASVPKCGGHIAWRWEFQRVVILRSETRHLLQLSDDSLLAYTDMADLRDGASPMTRATRRWANGSSPFFDLPTVRHAQSSQEERHLARACIADRALCRR